MVTELTPLQLTDYIRKIFETGTRRQLNHLTREIWRRYAREEGATVNAAALETLKARILERRQMLEKSEGKARIHGGADTSESRSVLARDRHVWQPAGA